MAGFTSLVESVLTPDQTVDQVLYRLWSSVGDYDDTTSTPLGSKIVTASGGNAEHEVTLARPQTVAGSEVYVTDGTKWIAVTYTNATAFFAVMPDSEYRADASSGSTSWVVGTGSQYGGAFSGATITLTTFSSSPNPSKMTRRSRMQVAWRQGAWKTHQRRLRT